MFPRFGRQNYGQSGDSLMNEILLDIKNLYASSDDKEILRGINLTVGLGEVHVVLGPNGSGKSTLMNVIMGHPSYRVTAGEIKFAGEDMLPLKTFERARRGLFLSFQNPAEIPGVSSFHPFRQRFQLHLFQQGLQICPVEG